MALKCQKTNKRKRAKIHKTLSDKIRCKFYTAVSLKRTRTETYQQCLKHGPVQAVTTTQIATLLQRG